MINLSNVTYQIENKSILNGINLNIKQGECVGLMGKNGCGKSTLLKIMATLIAPSSGSITINEHTIHQFTKVRPHINYSAGAPLGFYPRLTGLENLEFFSFIKGQPISLQEAIQLGNYVDLPQSSLEKKYVDFSLGMKQRLHLARLLLEPTKIVLVDEPTNGLDESGLNTAIEIFKNKLQAKTRVIVSHDKNFLESFCTRILNIENGSCHD